MRFTPQKRQERLLWHSKELYGQVATPITFPATIAGPNFLIPTGNWISGPGSPTDSYIAHAAASPFVTARSTRYIRMERLFTAPSPRRNKRSIPVISTRWEIRPSKRPYSSRLTTLYSPLSRRRRLRKALLIAHNAADVTTSDPIISAEAAERNWISFK